MLPTANIYFTTSKIYSSTLHCGAVLFLSLTHSAPECTEVKNDSSALRRPAADP